MEHQPINLGTETIEQSFTHFLSQSKPDNAVEHWEKQDFDDNFLETFKNKSAWEESTAKLVAAFSELLDSEELQEAQKTQHQAVEAALDSIEEALIDFYKTIGHLSAEDRKRDFAKTYLHQCFLKLDKIDNVFFQAKLGFENFPHLPRLTYLTAYILQAYLKLSTVEEDSGVIDVAFGRINQEIQIAMESVYRERHYRIKFELSGPYHNLAYVYDEHTKKSLTNWVELSENARKVHDTHHVLRERIADLYVQSLPFNQVSEMVTKFWGQGETTSWAAVKKNCVLIDLADESNAQLSASIKELTLDWVKASYFPEFSVAIQPLSVTRDLVREATEEILKEFLSGFLKTTAAKLAFAAVSPGFGVVFGLLFSAIWPSSGGMTEEQLLAEVQRLIEKALTEYEVQEIKRAFKRCFNDYELQFDLVRQETENDPEAVTVPSSWLTLLSSSFDLQERLLTPNRETYYQTHQLLSQAMVMRVNTLMGAYESYVASQRDPSVIANNMEQMLNLWYLYLEKLLDQSYYRTSAKNDITVKSYQSCMYCSGTWYVKDNIANTDLSYSYSSSSRPNISLNGIRNRFNYYVTINTELHNLCRGYDTTLRELRRVGIITKTLPEADGNIFAQNLMVSKYINSGNTFRDQARSANIWPGATAKWDLLLFSRANREAGPSGGDHGVRLSPHSLWLSVGDYPDLEDSRIFGSNLSGTRTLIIPVGLVAIVYDQKGFQGRWEQFPNAGNRNNSSHNIGISALRSMKVRIDVGNRWFPDKPNHHLGRLDTGFYYWDGGWGNPISPPLVQLP